MDCLGLVYSISVWPSYIIIGLISASICKFLYWLMFFFSYFQMWCKKRETITKETKGDLKDREGEDWPRFISCSNNSITSCAIPRLHPAGPKSAPPKRHRDRDNPMTSWYGDTMEKSWASKMGRPLSLCVSRPFDLDVNLRTRPYCHLYAFVSIPCLLTAWHIASLYIFTSVSKAVRMGTFVQSKESIITRTTSVI